MDDVLKKRQNLPAEYPSATCSCTRCESISCFAKRHYCTTCACDNCKSRTCTGDKIKVSHVDKLTAVYLKEAKSKLTPNRPEELTENDINFESDRHNVIINNQPPPKSLDEYIDRYFLQTPSERIGTKPESLIGYIDLISGKNTQVLDSYIQNLKAISSKKFLELKANGFKKSRSKCQENCKSICAGREIRCIKQERAKNLKRKELETEVRSVMLTSPNMDFSLRNKDTIVKNNVDKTSYESMSTAENSIFKYDIFTKIKEAYNACSCIVCDCIPSIKIQNNLCTCKPCECSDCTSYMSKSKSQKLDKLKVGLKYTPSEYKIRQFLKQTQNRQKDCACKPCDCALCQKFGSLKPCDCDQCQCHECKPTIVAGSPSGDKDQNIACQCAPCDCTECTRVYITGSKSSTKIPAAKKLTTPCHCEICPNDICAIGIESCKCQQRNSVLKPIDKDKQDFDLQTALILNDIYHHNDGTKKSLDMIAMYSALPRLRNYATSNINAAGCSCDECECLSCVCKEDTINAIKSSQLFSCQRTHSSLNQQKSSLMKHSSTKICDCTPCECQVCNYRKLQKESYDNTNESPKKNTVICSCKCDVCLCTDTLQKPRKRYGPKCKCSTCRCERCFGGEECVTTKILNTVPIKQGEVLTPSAHQTKVQKLMLAKAQLPATNTAGKLKYSSKSNETAVKRQQEVISYKIYNPGRSSSVRLKPSFAYRTVTNNNTVDVGTGFLESLNKSDIFKYDAYVQCRQWNKGRSSVNDSITTNKIYESCLSIYPSTESISKPSFYKENDTATSILDTKNVVQSSCNSSGYDHPRGYIRYPKSTAETCLEEVLMSNLGNEIKLNTFDTSIKRHREWVSEKKKLQSSTYKVIKPATSFSTTIDTNRSENLQMLKNRNMNFIKGRIYHDPQEADFSKKSYKHFDIHYDKDTINSNSYRIINSYATTNTEKKETISSPNVCSNCKRLDFINDLNQVQAAHTGSSRYNISNEKNINGDKSLTKLKESSHALFGCNIDSLNINLDEDYKRVKKTLEDANEFSMKLLKLLETYEKANKEFKKISDGLKISQTSIIKSKDLIANHELSGISTNVIGTSPPWSITAEEAKMLPNDSAIRSPNDSHVISQEYLLADLDNIIANQRSSNNMYKTPETINVKDHNKVRMHKMGHNLEKACHYDVKARQYSEKPGTKIKVVKPRNNSFMIVQHNEDITKKEERIRRRSGKKHGNPSKRILNISKRICLKKPNPNYVYETNSRLRMTEVTKDNQRILITEDQPCKDNETFNYADDVLDPIIDNTNQDFLATSINLSSSQSDEIHLEAEELSVITIPPSQSHIDANCGYQNEPQKADKLIGEQLLYKDKEISCVDLECMVHLEENVKALLNEFVMQPLGKENLIHEKIKDRNSYFCFESRSNLKVNFLLVRKVSDHTVLVKWSQPRDLTEVQGYELLVDGRAVQKIFNPSKCIAVVTCLPHTDKILLTIRTVTLLPSDAGHFPATTVIYRPRVKKQ